MSKVVLKSRQEIAQVIAADIADGAYVNLGIGQPTLVANYIAPEKEVVFHSENGILGMGPAPDEALVDYDLINAGKMPVSLVTGGAFFHHADSFSMIRGQHIDVCVLGAYQVAINGDLANWNTGSPEAIPAVGGAMDLAAGAKQVWVMMDLFTKKGQSKLVSACDYPLTGLACVDRIYSDHATFEITPEGVVVRDIVPGHTLEGLSELLGLDLLPNA